MSDALMSAKEELQYVYLSAVPAYQYAAKEGESAGNYNLDAIATLTLSRPGISWMDQTNLVMWVNSSDKIDGLKSAPELAQRAGLSWDTNDISADSASTSLLVLGVEQWFFDKSLSVGVGKYFPGQYFLLSDYTADNSNTFGNKMISGNPAASFWEAIGLGANAVYYMDEWAIAGGFVDAQATADGLDFSSFGKGKYAYMLELDYEPKRADGVTSMSILGYRVSARNDVRSEQGIAAQFTHEFGDRAEYAAFGRYTIRSGGKGRNPAARPFESPVEQGGFLGIAWNRPFGREHHQLAASVIYGEATDFRKSQGFNNQYGLETYWKYQPSEWFHITPSAQLLRNSDNKLETVVGLRANLWFDRNW